MFISLLIFSEGRQGMGEGFNIVTGERVNNNIDSNDIDISLIVLDNKKQGVE